jgi:putative ABC transport system permease protein
VCLLEPEIARELFPGKNPVNEEITLSDGQTLRVIGILKKRPAAALRTDAFGYEKEHAFSGLVQSFIHILGVLPSGLDWLNSERNVIVPWRFLDIPPRWILLRTAPEGLTDTVEEIKQYFASEHGTQVMVYSNVLLTVLLAPELEGMMAINRDIFIICLLVGLVVIANVMLLSVNERRVEIAIRRCEGARTVDIVTQFLIETGAFCSAGAVLGIPLGLFLAWVRASIAPEALLNWALPWHHILVTVLSVIAGGILAGLAPAWRAARLDPVEVLSRA